MHPKFKVRIGVISFLTLIMLGVCVIFYGAIFDFTTPYFSVEEKGSLSKISTETNVFSVSYAHLEPSDGPSNSRNLKSFYQLRQYLGSPPPIPHPLVEEIKSMEGKKVSCLACHFQGGFVQKFQAYAPITPHPQFSNCLQCHVPQKTKTLFKKIIWKSMAAPKLNQRGIAMGPLIIPHSLNLRGNCLSCHGGAAAVKEIRTTHPERRNCRQCHVPQLSF